MRIAERLSPVAAAVSALATLACCVPLGFAGAFGALGLAIVSSPLQPWFLAASVGFLAIGIVQWYRVRSCQRRSRVGLAILGLCGTIVLTVLLFPQELAQLIAGYL